MARLHAGLHGYAYVNSKLTVTEMGHIARYKINGLKKRQYYVSDISPCTIDDQKLTSSDMDDYRTKAP